MWSNFEGTARTREQTLARINTLQWSDWRPQGITLHNTAAPTLAQWAETGPRHDARISNLQSFYENEKGWHAGPHWFVSRNWINWFSDPLRPGVHSRCFNATRFGIEMVDHDRFKEYNDLFGHDKSMLIGSTNTPGVDVGKLRVTLHHNRFADLGQRMPRVRFGQVDVYNNLYRATDNDTFIYALGVGVQSAIYAENNFVQRSDSVPVEDFVFNWGGTVMTEKGTLMQTGRGPIKPVNLLAAYNAAFDPDIAPDAGWTPTLRTRLDPTILVPILVGLFAGAKLPA